jgi:hypothetical protein
MNGSIFANAAHGGGHLFLFLLGGPPPALELEPTPAAIGNLIMLVCFWYGVLKNIVVSFSSRAALIASVVVLTIQYLLDVPGKLSFTFSQSVILFAGALDQLLLKEKGFTYLASATTYFPILFLCAVEMTNCQNLLAPYFGGHGVYDFYLAVLPFLHYGVVRAYDDSHRASKLKST